MQTHESIQSLINNCSYKPGWYFICGKDDNRSYIQIGVNETADISLCPFTGKRQAWKGAKHYLSYHMCDSEVVGAVFGAIRQAEEHEIREWFRFDSRSIFNPHINVYVLAEIATRNNMDLRKNAMTMVE